MASPRGASNRSRYDRAWRPVRHQCLTGQAAILIGVLIAGIRFGTSSGRPPGMLIVPVSSASRWPAWQPLGDLSVDDP